ncbi:MAG TPA: hypothetical protein EYH03_06215 [Chromatiales bacterium]|nr:hypothetical protein [Chromatiales bacterium]
MSIRKSGKCWKCGATLSPSDYGREAVCPACGTYTHVCLNCVFYSPGRSNNCMEPIAEYVADKRRANFCDYFEPTDSPASEKSTSSDETLKAAEDLFKL